MNGQLDLGPIGTALAGALRDPLEGHRGQGRAVGRILHRVKSEHGEGGRLAQLLDPPRETVDLLDADFECPARLEQGGFLAGGGQRRVEQSEAPLLPPDRGARGRHVGDRPGRRWLVHRALAAGTTRRLRLVARPDAELGDSIPDGVAPDAEAGGGPGHVPVRLAQGVQQPLALGVLRRIARGRVRRRSVRRRCNGQAQHAGGDGAGIRKERDALHDVRKFAHVAGPCVRAQRSPGVRREHLGRKVVFGAGSGQEVLGELQDVIAPLPQRRKREGDDREAMIEVFPELAGPDGRREVLVRRGDDPDVHRFTSRAAQAPDPLLFDRAQELHLKPDGKEADLVEKQRAAVGGAKEAGLGLPGVRERPALDAEHLGLEQRVGNGRAVDVDEGAGGARAHAVQGPREQALSRPGLAPHENRGETARVGAALHESGHRVPHGHHPRGVPQQLGQRGHGARILLR